LGCPKYQNIIFRVQARDDAASYNTGPFSPPNTDEDKKNASEVIAAHASANIEKMKGVMFLFNEKEIGAGEANRDQHTRDVHAALNGIFQGPKVFTYALDKLVWEALHGGTAYLTLVLNGGLLANIVAHAIVRGALRRPTPQFPPWGLSVGSNVNIPIRPSGGWAPTAYKPLLLPS
jgi:hypothetical protein